MITRDPTSKTHPRTLGQQFSLTLSAVALACALAACGGGGGGDTSTPGTTPTANPDPTPTNPVVRIASAIGCDVQTNQKACEITVVTDTSVPATAQIVGGLTVAVAAGTGTEVKLTSVQVGSNTVLLSVPGTTGTPAQTTVSVQCAPGLTLDTVSGECRAKVTKTYNLAVYSRDSVLYLISGDVLLPVIDGTGLGLYNCRLPIVPVVNKLGGYCVTNNLVPSVRVKVQVDPVTLTATVDGPRPGEVGFAEPDVTQYLGVLQNSDPGKGYVASLDTVDTDGVAVTYFVPVADPTDLLKLKNGVTTQIVDGKDYFVDGTVRDMRAFTFEQ